MNNYIFAFIFLILLPAIINLCIVVFCNNDNDNDYFIEFSIKNDFDEIKTTFMGLLILISPIISLYTLYIFINYYFNKQNKKENEQ